jgi:hypothetical protein
MIEDIGPQHSKSFDKSVFEGLASTATISIVSIGIIHFIIQILLKGSMEDLWSMFLTA